MEKEVWKPVVGYETSDEISNMGRMRIINYRNTGKYKLRKLTINKGYFTVNLTKNSITKLYQVHRLVAEAFIPNPQNLPCVNHKDECKTNNIYTNLEWCDIKYNNLYGTRNERIGQKNKNGKLSKTVLQYDLNGNFIKEWPSARECGRNGFNQSSVSACCRGELKTHKGFVWKYK